MKILYMVSPRFELDHQIIDNSRLFCGAYVKNCLYCHLVSYSCIIKYKGHNLISKNAFRWVASCGLLIFWRHLNLITSYGTVHEWQRFMPCSWVDHHFCDWQRQVILWKSAVEIPEVYINVKLLVFLPDWHDICDLCWVLDLANESCLYEFVGLFFDFWYQL